MIRSLFGLLLGMGAFLMEQNANAIEDYRLPPQDVVDIVDAAPAPGVSFSPDRKHMLLIHRDAMPPIADVARRMLRLGGMRIDPAANSRFFTLFNKRIQYRTLGSQTTIDVPFPEDAKIAGISWSHHSDSFAVTTVNDSGSQLWVVDCTAPKKPRLLHENINTVTAGAVWFPDGKKILVQLVPSDRGAEPKVNPIPTGPRIQESIGNTSPTRTYQDLLKNPYDESLFEYYTKNQLAIIDFSGQKTNVFNIGKPMIYGDYEVSPDGSFLLIETVHKPFSYLMTWGSFPKKIQVLDVQGNPKYTVADVPLAENIPIEGVRTGRRNVTWMSSQDASLVWNEALDGGDPNRDAKHRDAFFSLAAPFTDEPTELVRTEHRAFGMSYMANPNWVVTRQYDRDRRWVTSLLHDLSTPQEEPKVLMDRSIRDRYNDPGGIVTIANKNGHAIIKQDGEFIYRIGAGASSEGDLPFIDRQNIVSLTTERLWRCKKGSLESVVAVAESRIDDKPVIITRRQSSKTPPNYYLRELGNDRETALTDFSDPTPQIRGITKQLVTYNRDDGVPLSATLYLPAGYKAGTRLPLLVWAYPREFNDVKTAGQVSGSEDTFTRIGGISHLTFLTQGYAIMDAATMPVIGDPETMNDTFIDQIVAAAEAAIDKAVEMGVADRNRVGVGGHSYGAFMTANLLAHCDLFKAGIARSGAYNRTLTPFGFQSERRSLWDAKSIYFGISPFLHADKIQEPLLLIHGEEDNNSGTFPMQSRRMYQAVKGNGGIVRLVMLPEESHGYRARESVLHTQAEMIEWFDRYVKSAPRSKSQP